MTNELLLMALNVIKEYCIAHNDYEDEEGHCQKCKMREVCDEYFDCVPFVWKLELVEK